jgi:hypothetical protein
MGHKPHACSPLSGEKQETAPGAVIAIQTFGDFLLLRKGKITEELVKLIMSRRHSLSACTAQAGGFNVPCGHRIQSGDEEAMENLARYIILTFLPHERMTCVPDDFDTLPIAALSNLENL